MIRHLLFTFIISLRLLTTLGVAVVPLLLLRIIILLLRLCSGLILCLLNSFRLAIVRDVGLGCVLVLVIIIVFASPFLLTLLLTVLMFLVLLLLFFLLYFLL